VRRRVAVGTVAALAVLFLAGSVAAQAQPAPQLAVYTVDSLARVRPDDPPRPAAPCRLSAARNEYESCQVVIRAGEAPVRDVDVVVGALRRQGGGAIEANNITAYREHYVQITKSSPKATEPPGWYPDALIPLRNPVTGQPLSGGRFVGAPFSVAANTNQPVWIDVYVPKGTLPGKYAGEIRVLIGGRQAAAVPCEVTVWGFALPDAPSLRSHFGSFGSRVARGHGMDVESPAFRQVEEGYAEEVARHRLNPPIPFWFKPTITADGTIDPATTPAYAEWIRRFRINAIPLWLVGKDPLGKDRERNANYLRSTYAFLKRHGWEGRAYVYVLDEPHGHAAFEELRRRAAFVHAVQPGLKVLCTTEPRPRDRAWGPVAGSVDIWVSLWPHFDEAAIAERQQAGDEGWSYTAVTQGPAGVRLPYWQLDFSLINYRIPMWLSWRYGLTGLLYWTTVYWEKTNPWTDPKTYGDYNGEGSLLYPGADVGFPGPIASMRLKAIRDGMEDYEYLHLLAGLRGRSAPREFSDRLAASWTAWQESPAMLRGVREEVGELLGTQWRQ
jgi:hypothetical protein